MSDSIKKWEEMQEEEREKRQKVIAQNGNTGEHYFDNTDDDAELPPFKKVTAPFQMENKVDSETLILGKIDTYVFNPNKKLTLEDVPKILSGIGLQIVDFGSGVSENCQELIDQGFFIKKQD